MVSLWVDSANGPLRAAYDEVVREADAEFVACLVTESAPLPGESVDGRPGYTQVAMTDQGVFFDAVGDVVRQKADVEALMASVQAFLDFDLIDVVPTSEYAVSRGSD